jgi:hypothetical protein
MLPNWTSRPREIKDDWPEDIDYMLFVDENNHPKQLKLAQRLAALGQPMSIHDRFFTVTGCAIHRPDFPVIRQGMVDLKNRHWPDGCFQCPRHNRTERVCLHSSGIRKREYPFSDDLINHEVFIRDLSDFMRNAKYQVFSVIIDLYGHASRYFDPAHPYTLAMEFILERFGKWFLGSQNKTGVLVMESRGEAEDRHLLRYCKAALESGTGYATANELQRIKGVFFNPKCTKDEDRSYLGLEIADLTSYPIYKYGKTGEKDAAYLTIEPKFYRYPYYSGSGLKFFP